MGDPRLRIRGRWPAMFVAVALGVAPSFAAPSQQAPTAKPAADAEEHLFGIYLAGKHAEQVRDYPAAAAWFDKAATIDPGAPELISRDFLMAVGAGDFDRAKTVAPQELQIDSSDVLAEMVLIIDRLKAGDGAGAVEHAQALSQDGIHRFIVPAAQAWAKMAAGDLPGADAALQQYDQYNGFEPLKNFQLGLLYDYAGNAAKAEEYYNKALDATTQLNWRLTDAIANFYERHGKEAAAKALYKEFTGQNAGSEIARSVLAARPAGVPKPQIGSAADGLAESLFDLASVLNQTETLDLALVYVRFSLALQPNFRLAQLLLSDILSAQDKPELSLAVLDEIPRNSPYSWSARLRVAANLEALDRTDEAIAQLRQMAAESPTSISAYVQLGDVLRNKKQFKEAAAAYDEAITRAAAQGLPDRWTLLYDRGVSYERSGDWTKAEADLEHALELKPDQAIVLNYLGYSWVDKGEKLDQGLKMIEKAIELRPKDGYIVDSLGWAHYRMGDYAGAVKYLERAVELVPDDSTINDHLGDAYWRTGRQTEARYQWRRALQFGPEQEDIPPIEGKLAHGLAPPPTAAPAERGG